MSSRIVSDKTRYQTYLSQPENSCSAMWARIWGERQEKELCREAAARRLDSAAIFAKSRTSVGNRGGGWYMGTLAYKADPSYQRHYVGQAKSIRTRIQDHEKKPTQRGKKGQKSGFHARTSYQSKSLLYRQWGASKSRQMRWLVLGVTDCHSGPTCDVVYPNMVEHFYCLIFGTMVDLRTMRHWLPSGWGHRLTIPHGPNVRMALMQNTKWGDEWRGYLFWYSPDPELRRYAREHLAEIQKLATIRLHDLHWRPCIIGKHRLNGTPVLREWRPGDGPLPWKAYCQTCSHERIDEATAFVKDDVGVNRGLPGMYVVRPLNCEGQCKKRTVHRASRTLKGEISRADKRLMEYVKASPEQAMVKRPATEPEANSSKAPMSKTQLRRFFKEQEEKRKRGKGDEDST